jgi:hypothetical protein
MLNRQPPTDRAAELKGPTSREEQLMYEHPQRGVPDARGERFLRELLLLLMVASLALLRGAAFALIPFFPPFLLARLGFFAGMEERTVRQHNPLMDGREWRDGARRREVISGAALVDRPAPGRSPIAAEALGARPLRACSRAREIAAHAGTAANDALERAAERRA